MNKILAFVLILTLLCSITALGFADGNIVKLGYQGEEVKQIQLKLIAFGYLDNKCKLGFFGENTQAALSKFQIDNNLNNDGVAGNKTYNAIELTMQQLKMDGKYKIGDAGEDVRIIQMWLVEKGYLGSFSISGEFGQITENAVKQFQEDNGLVVDGIVGKNTLMKLIGTQLLDMFLQDYSAPHTKYLDNLYSNLDDDQKKDIYLLSQLITAESGNQPYMGQVAVGSVVMNRMQYYKLPMYDIIFMKNAFSVAKNGKIDKIPTQQCRYAAIQAYFGAKPVSSARFFNAKHITTSWAATHCTLYKIIGNHAFYI